MENLTYNIPYFYVFLLNLLAETQSLLSPRESYLRSTCPTPWWRRVSSSSSARTWRYLFDIYFQLRKRLFIRVPSPNLANSTPDQIRCTCAYDLHFWIALGHFARPTYRQCCRTLQNQHEGIFIFGFDTFSTLDWIYAGNLIISV